MILHKSKYVEITYEKENSLIIDKFLPLTEDMDTEKFKKEMLIFVEMCEKYKPEHELVHLLDMKYVIAPDEQEWLNTEIFPKYKNIIKRIAFFVSPEIFVHVSISQTMNEKVGKKFVQKYFESETEARKWLMKK